MLFINKNIDIYDEISDNQNINSELLYIYERMEENFEKIIKRVISIMLAIVLIPIMPSSLASAKSRFTSKLDLPKDNVQYIVGKVGDTYSEYTYSSEGQKFRVIDEFKHKFSIRTLCKLLSCSKSGYFAWVNLGRPKYKAFNEKFNQLVLDTYSKNNTWGVRQLYMQIKKDK